MIVNRLSIISWGIPCSVTVNFHKEKGRTVDACVVTVKESDIDASIPYLMSQCSSLFWSRRIPYITDEELMRQTQSKGDNSHITGILSNAPPFSATADATNDIVALFNPSTVEAGIATSWQPQQYP